MNRRLVLAVVAVLGSAACSSPDEASGDVHLVVVAAPVNATPGDATPQTLMVRVVNGDNASVAGVPVAWSIRSGGGHVAAGADTSGVDGLAAAQWTPGLATGVQEIGASINGDPALVIAVNAGAFRADKLATNFERGCGLQGTAVWCWRDDYPARSTRRILPQFEAHDIAATYQFVCILDAAGTAYCNRAFDGLDAEANSTVSGLPPLKSLSAGARFFCGVALADDTPWCWRDFDMVATHLSPSPALSRLSTGGTYACGLDPTGAAWCWGVPGGSPAMISGGHSFQSVSVYDDYPVACGVEGAGLWCWYGSGTPLRLARMSAGQVALAWPFALFNTGPVAMTARVLLDGETATIPGLEVHEERAFPGPVRQVYPTCVLTYDSEAYCLATKDINADVIPLPTYWKAVAAPQP